MSYLKLKIFVLIFLLTGTTSCNQNNRKDIAKVSYTSNGCFGTQHTRIEYYSNSDGMFARVHFDNQKDSTVAVSDVQLAQLRTFVSSLKGLKGKDGCTSSIEYAVSIEGESIKRMDNGCQEIGFDGLVKNLFRLTN